MEFYGDIKSDFWNFMGTFLEFYGDIKPRFWNFMGTLNRIFGILWGHLNPASRMNTGFSDLCNQVYYNQVFIIKPTNQDARAREAGR